MTESERLQTLMVSMQSLRDEVASFTYNTDALAARIRETAPRILELEHELASFTQDVARFGLYAAEQLSQVAVARLVGASPARTQPDREPTGATRLPDIVAPCALGEPRR
jgi:hypothetical protein